MAKDVSLDAGCNEMGILYAPNLSVGTQFMIVEVTHEMVVAEIINGQRERYMRDLTAVPIPSWWRAVLALCSKNKITDPAYHIYLTVTKGNLAINEFVPSLVKAKHIQASRGFIPIEASRLETMCTDAIQRAPLRMQVSISPGAYLALTHELRELRRTVAEYEGKLR